VDAIRDHVTHAIRLDAADEETLREQPLKRFDAVIVSFGEEFETALLAVMHLKQMGVKRVIVRATTARHEQILQLLGVEEVILPVSEAVTRLSMSLMASDLVVAVALPDDYAIVEVAAPDSLIEREVGSFNFPETLGVSLVTIIRTRRESRFFGMGTRMVSAVLGILPPSAKVERGDVLVLFGPRARLEEFSQQ
jgi:trk system potassium uptake protein TrkA